MKRLYLAVLFLLYASSIIAQTAGSLVIGGEYITPQGCLAFLNNPQSLKKTGLCSFSIIAQGAKVPDLSCNSTDIDDTIINCTYSPIKKLSGTYNASPNMKAGDMLLPAGYVSTVNGCFSALNIESERCAFNINLRGVELKNLVLTSKVSGGDTWLEGTYSPQ